MATTISIPRFEGKVALVTAGASGIGAATAEAFARAGAAVVIADLDEEGGTANAARLSDAGHRTRFVRADAADERDVAALVATTVETFGGLDIAANVVGGMAGGDRPRNDVLETTVEQWEGTMAVNLRATWLCMKHEIAYMKDHGDGAIVNVSSLAGLIGRSDASVAYGVAKAGIVSLTRIAASTYGRDGVRINAVAPGLTATEGVRRDLTPEQQIPKQHVIPRMVEPSEIADAILWLSSDASSMVTGQTVPVDGGWSSR